MRTYTIHTVILLSIIIDSNVYAILSYTGIGVIFILRVGRVYVS